RHGWFSRLRRRSRLHLPLQTFPRLAPCLHHAGKMDLLPLKRRRSRFARARSADSASPWSIAGPRGSNCNWYKHLGHESRARFECKPNGLTIRQTYSGVSNDAALLNLTVQNPSSRPKMRSAWRIFVSLLCIALVVAGGTVQAVHVHPQGDLSHSDCALCVTAH